MNRRQFLVHAGAVALAPVVVRCFAGENVADAVTSVSSGVAMSPSALAKIKVVTDVKAAAITFLSWDRENTGREGSNLLRADRAVSIQYMLAGETVTAAGKLKNATADTTVYEVAIGGDVTLAVTFCHPGNALEITLALDGAVAQLSALEIFFPFATQPAAVTALPGKILADATFQAPIILHAPDFGQLLITANVELTAQLAGNYAQRAVDFILRLPEPVAHKPVHVQFTPHYLPEPAGLSAPQDWPRIRRGWFNTLQCVSGPAPGDDRAADPDQVPAGMLGNEVISGTASCSIWIYADHVLLMPQLGGDISAANLLRYTLDWTFAHRVRADGTVVCYWINHPFDQFLDSHPSLLIAAWDYVEATNDLAWLAKNLPMLERLAEYLAARDVDHDGLIEAIQSGNPHTLKDPDRGCSWFDAINSGHKDAFCNALSYRAFLCFADLQTKLHHAEQAGRYRGLAGKLKAAFVPALMNPATGWLAWWRSADGQLHDPASPFINGLAAAYGLLDPATGRTVLDKIFDKMAAENFTRFDLGIPPILTPIPKADYIGGFPPGIAGVPSKEDGSDSFGHYQNGGIHAGLTLPVLVALYQLGRHELADKILQQMLGRQDKGLFQNGVWGEYDKGIEWTTWTGEPAGADGTLADNCRFLAAVLLRETRYRQRLLRPMMAT